MTVKTGTATVEADQVTVKADSITLDATTTTCTGTLSVQGVIETAAGMKAAGDITGAGISLSKHIHQETGNKTGAPQ